MAKRQILQIHPSLPLETFSVLRTKVSTPCTHHNPQRRIISYATAGHYRRTAHSATLQYTALEEHSKWQPACTTRSAHLAHIWLGRPPCRQASGTSAVESTASACDSVAAPAASRYQLVLRTTSGLFLFLRHVLLSGSLRGSKDHKNTSLLQTTVCGMPFVFGPYSQNLGSSGLCRLLGHREVRLRQSLPLILNTTNPLVQNVVPKM